MTLQEIITEVKTLSINEQKQLIKLLVDIVSEPHLGSATKTRNLRELRGLGKEIWAGVDAQEYIHQQRDEWDTRS
jgi:hypothetical protein